MGLTRLLPLIALAVIVLFLFYILPRRKKACPSDDTSRRLYHLETGLLTCCIVFFAALSIDKAGPIFGPLFGPPAHHTWLRSIHPSLNGLFWVSVLACAAVHFVLKKKKL